MLLLPGAGPAYEADFEKNNSLILPVSPEKKRYLYDAALTGKADAGHTPTSQMPLRAQIDPSGLHLEEAITIAVQTHPSIRSAVELLAQQGYLISAAKAGYYPQIGVEMRTERETDEDLAITPTLYLSQMVYDFGRVRSEVRHARAGLGRQTLLAMDQVDTIVQQTARALIGVHRYQKQLEFAEMQIENVEKVVQMAEQRAKSGLTSNSDPIQAQTRLEAARANLLTVRTLLNQSREQLALLIGFRYEGAIAPMDPELFSRADIYNKPDFGNMTVVLLAHADYNLADARLGAAQSAAYPTIGLVASTGKTLTGDNPNTGEDKDDYSTVGLNISQTLYQGGRISSQRKAAASARESASQSLASAELRAKEQIYVARLEIEGLLEKRKILTRRTHNIRTTRSLYQDQYQLGTRSVLDLLNSEQEYYQAVSEELAAEHEFWNGLVQYLVLKGDARGIFRLDSRLDESAP